MKKLKIFALLSSLFLSASVFGQNEQNIRLTVLEPVSETIDATALSALYNNLNQAVSLNEMNSYDVHNRFLMYSEVSVVDTQKSTTVPAVYIAQIEVTVYFLDNEKKTILAQETLSAKGTASVEDKAVMKAVRSIKARDSKLKKVINIGRNKAAEILASETEYNDAPDVDDNGTPDVSWMKNFE